MSQKGYEVRITAVENGVIVNVGCKTFVHTDIDKAMSEVTKYLKDPRGMQEIYGKLYGGAEDAAVPCRTLGGLRDRITPPMEDAPQMANAAAPAERCL